MSPFWSRRSSSVICVGVLVATLIGTGVAKSVEREIGMPPPLSIKHQPPATVEPGLDLILSFSVSGDCEGSPPGAYAHVTLGPPGTISPGGGLEVGECGPLSGSVTYDSGTGQSTVAATFAPRDLQGSRAGTVTIPGSGLPSGATLTYSIEASQSRTYTTAQSGAMEQGCLVGISEPTTAIDSCVVHRMAPYADGPYESSYTERVSRGATIQIADNP